MSTYAVVHYEDYSALYVDGELKMWSDSYYIEDYLIREILGVRIVPSAAMYELAEENDEWQFGPPKTLAELEALTDGADE
jgi:hypothetical protein